MTVQVHVPQTVNEVERKLTFEVAPTVDGVTGEQKTALVIWRDNLFSMVTMDDAQRVELIKALGGHVAPF